MNILKLPRDMLINLLAYLRPASLARIATVNKKLRRLIRSKDLIIMFSKKYYLPYSKDYNLSDMNMIFKLDSYDLVQTAAKLGNIECILHWADPLMYNKILGISCKYNHITIVQKMLDLGAINYYIGYMNAYKKANSEIVDLLTIYINEFYKSFEEDDNYRNYRYTVFRGRIIHIAIAKGHDDNIDLTLFDQKSKNAAMTAAAHIGYKHIIDELLKLGADDYNGAMICAVKKENMDIIKQMLDCGANNYIEVANMAAYHGHISIIENMLLFVPEITKVDYVLIMSSAARGGHVHILKNIWDKLLQHGFKLENIDISLITSSAVSENRKIIYDNLLDECDHYNIILADAIKAGNNQLINSMIKKGAYNFTSEMKVASIHGHLSIVKRMIRSGANDFMKCLSYSVKNGHEIIAKIMLDNIVKEFNNVCNTEKLDMHEIYCLKEMYVTSFDKIINKILFYDGCISLIQRYKNEYFNMES